jgi:invasion protein IalB
VARDIVRHPFKFQRMAHMAFKSTSRCLAILVSTFLLSPLQSHAADWALACDDAKALCVSQGALVSENGDRPAALGLQLSKDGSNAVIFVTTPLGTAIRPGLKLRSGNEEFLLVFDVCFPDGCRATSELSSQSLATFLSLTDVDLLLFPFGNDQPLILNVPLKGLKESFSGSVSLP